MCARATCAPWPPLFFLVWMRARVFNDLFVSVVYKATFFLPLQSITLEARTCRIVSLKMQRIWHED